MAIESYIMCIGNADIFDVEKTIKISHLQVRQIVTKGMLIGNSNEKLFHWFSESMSKVKA